MLDKPNISADLSIKVREVLRLIRTGKPVVTVSGPAGTGKSTLIREVINAFEGRICVAALTGQATRMLQKKGIAATTIHRLIYHTKVGDAEEIARLRAEIETLNSEGRIGSAAAKQLETKLRRLTNPRFVRNEESEVARASLCIIDEASMVPKGMGQDLRCFGVPLLAVGDPYQLGPVNGEPHFQLGRPDVLLEKIYRQDEGSQILELSQLVRDRKARKYREHKGSGLFIRNHRSMNNDDVRTWMKRADQIICATNNTRRSVNRRMLQYLGMPVDQVRYPQGREGEKLVCLKNNHTLNIFNGMPIRITDVEETSNPIYFSATVLADEGVRDDGEIQWTSRGRANIYKGQFDFTADQVSQREAEKRAQTDILSKPDIVDCDWGYCITVHKAQGSEWDKVLFLSESWPDADEVPDTWAQLHYTAITRARKRLAIIDNWGKR